MMYSVRTYLTEGKLIYWCKHRIIYIHQYIIKYSAFNCVTCNFHGLLPFSDDVLFAKVASTDIEMPVLEEISEEEEKKLLDGVGEESLTQAKSKVPRKLVTLLLPFLKTLYATMAGSTISAV